MLERGELKTRIYAIRSIAAWEILAKTGVRAAFGSDMLRIGGVKGFADGSLGSSTARFFQPYSDAPQTRGLLVGQMLPEGIMLQRAGPRPVCGRSIRDRPGPSRPDRPGRHDRA